MCVQRICVCVRAISGECESKEGSHASEGGETEELQSVVEYHSSSPE